jgi:hypothetical protein
VISLLPRRAELRDVKTCTPIASVINFHLLHVVARKRAPHLSLLHRHKRCLTLPFRHLPCRVCIAMSEEKTFDLPVDSEHKALKIKLHSFAAPHMRAFHLIWFGFFTAFVSVFAPAAMIPVIRQALDLNKETLGNAGAPAVAATLFSVSACVSCITRTAGLFATARDPQCQPALR